MKLIGPAVCFLVVSAATCSAFNGHRVSEGPLTLTIGSVSTVTNLNQPQLVQVTFENGGTESVTASLSLTGLVEECVAIGATEYSVKVPASGTTNVIFRFSMLPGTLSALYPLHVIATVDPVRTRLHAIQIFSSDIPAAPKPAHELSPLSPPAGGTLSLTSVKDCRIAWSRFDQALQSQPIGWEGSDSESGTFFGRGPVVRGQTRQALQFHPPYKGGAGTVFAEYRVRLPEITPIQLHFFNAIRDHSETEPPSDGVTFRVWVGDTSVFEHHTDSKTWRAGNADLSPWAGKEALLRLETHPGPRRNTVCDSAYWGEPVLISGPRPPQLTAEQKRELASLARRAVRTGRGGTNLFVFEMEQDMRAALALGPNGMVDGMLAFGNESAVVFDGFNLTIAEQTLGSSAGLRVEKTDRGPDGVLTITHSRGASTAPVLARLWTEGPALKVRISCSDHIDDLSVGPADVRARRVYYGHGYCLVDPGKFRAGGGGHNLSTSHVGFDFDSRVSLLMACDTPPDYFQVDGEEHVYALHTHPNTTFAFVPGTNGAFDCALRYRPIYDKQPAPALARKAGRFVFDIWGGRYAADADLLRRCFDYGLTNSLAIMHVWQRWGYDYRLPDIFPPQPGLGTPADLQALAKVCDEAGVLWGLHDNYIDIYPDATGFSYDHVTFDAEGRPRKAWLNEGRNAQSYQFRPDHVRPFLERNLNLIEPALKPSSYFVDVWTSINAFDYRDRQGRFHSKMETLRCWGEGFARIREACGGGPTTSEAGSDQLIGWLEGADCQFLQLGSGKRFHNNAPCRDWERVPWFDAVNHARFSLHGVGYSDRYQGGRSRDLHGIESDDYMSAEILTGHALMIDLPGMVRGAVRKYWLAQPFIENVALDDMAAFDFVGGDLHRLHVRWNSGAEVWVNRGSNDWPIAGRTLPPFGYYTRNGNDHSAIERLNGGIVEQSRSGNIRYFNGRGYNPAAPLAIEPTAERIDYLGNRSFHLPVQWRAESPAPKDLTVFYHFSRPTPGRYLNTEFYGGGKPAPATSRWSGSITTGTNWTVNVPEGMPLGEYDVLVGLYDGDGHGERYRLLGEETAGRRYRIGTLTLGGAVSGGATNISNIRFAKSLNPRTVASPIVNRHPTDFGSVLTKGAVRIVQEPHALVLIPLPGEADFDITARLELLTGRSAEPESLHRIDARGRRQGPIPFHSGSGEVTFRATSGAFAYRLELKR